MNIVDVSLPNGKSCVEEGEFVDVSEVAKDMGFKAPVLFSSGLYEKYTSVDGVADHLNDVLMAFKFSAAKRWDGQHVVVDSVSSKAICMLFPLKPNDEIFVFRDFGGGGGPNSKFGKMH